MTDDSDVAAAVAVVVAVVVGVAAVVVAWQLKQILAALVLP